MSAYAGITQLVERQPSKLEVAGSNPVSRSIAADYGLCIMMICYNWAVIRLWMCYVSTV